MYSNIIIRYLYRGFFFNALLLLGFGGQLLAQSNVDIDGPNNLELNCFNLDFTIVTSWLNDYTVTTDCSGSTRVINDYDGTLPDICGEPKFVKWIVTDECGGIDSAGAVITIDTDLAEFGFTICPTQVSIFKSPNCEDEIVFPSPYARNCFGEMEVNQVPNSAGSLFRSGDVFPEGDTELIFIANDECDNLDSCRFNIIVIESTALINQYCPIDETVRICSNIEGCGWDSSEADHIRVGTSFLGCAPIVEISYRITLPTGQGITSSSLDDDDGDATGFTFPLGESQLCYIIEDSGGSSECCFTIFVEDCDAPTLICPSTANFSCDQAVNQDNLMEWLNLSIVSDNCDLNPTVRSVVLDTVGTCGADEQIELLVISSDGSGNESACIGRINITDEVGPEIIVTRLPDEIMECQGIVRNQELFLEWLARDGGFNETHIMNNCESDVTWSFDPSSTTFQTLEGTCSPNVGFYDVAFTAVDRCGNTSNTARARLLFEDTTPPEVIVPDSLTLDCDIPNLEAAIEDLLRDVVVIDSCSAYSAQSSVDIEFLDCVVGDNLFEVDILASDACGNETRVIDTINLVSLVRSTIQAPPDLTLRCGEPIDSLIQLWLESYTVDLRCDSFSVFNNFDSDRFDVCGFSQQVIWVLRDTCGSTNTASSILTINDDDLAPVFLNCPANVVLDVSNPDCTANFLFDIPMAEDCNGDVQLRQDLDPNGEILTSGSDFPIGVTELRFIATDICGNQAECAFNVTVRNDPTCSLGSLSISGNVSSPIGVPLTNVLLTLNAPLSEFPVQQLSDDSGDFNFDPLNGRIDYSLSLDIDDTVANGLSTADLVRIRNHIIGIQLFDTQVQVLASDANNDQALSAVDLVLLQNVIIGFQDTLPTNEIWRFIDENELVNTTLLPWPTLNVFEYPNLLNSINQDIVAYKIGDVNNSVSINNLLESENRSILFLEYEDRILAKGETITVGFTTNSDLSYTGMQLEFDLVNISFKEVNSNYFNITTQNVYSKNGKLIVNAFEQKDTNGDLLEIEFEVLHNGRLSDFLKLSNSQLTPELYTGLNADEYLVALTPTSQPIETLVIDVYPNPVKSVLEFDVRIPMTEQAKIELFSVTGEKIYSEEITGKGDKQHFQINEPLQPGIYFLNATHKQKSTSTKVVVL